MTNVRTAHLTGQTVRYHTNPVMVRLLQSDADHSWGVAMILLKLHPNPSRNLIAQAIVHDSGEKWAGDMSWPFKRHYPLVAHAHRKAEAELSEIHGIPKYDLTPEEQEWLAFADRLECHFYAEIYHPWVAKQPSWVKTQEEMIETAKKLGITEDLFAPAWNLFT